MGTTGPFETESPRDGGPAFGYAAENGHCCGMTLRDYFAGQALVGTIAAHRATAPTDDAAVTTDMYESFATTAYRIADAMLAERSR